MSSVLLESLLKCGTVGYLRCPTVPNHYLLRESKIMANPTVSEINVTVTEKRCCACEQMKPASEFHRSKSHFGGLVAKCKACIKKYQQTKWPDRDECIKRATEAQKEKQRLFREQDPDGFTTWLTEKNRKYWEKHGGNILQKRRQEAADNPEVRKKRYAASADWAKRNRDKVLAAIARYRITKKDDVGYRVSNAMSCGMWNTLRGSKNYRSWESLIGYTTEDLMAHLIKTMPKGYTWDDYLNGKLHIDHIIPKSVFNFKTPEDIDFKRCWELKNLQLLPAKENIRKHARLTKPFQPSFSGI